MPKALVPADEKLLVDDHDHCGQQQLGQAHGDVVSVVKGGDWPSPHHVSHGEIHEDDQENKGPDETPFQHGCVMVCEGVFCLSSMICAGSCAALLGGAVSSVFYRVDNILGRGSAFHPHGVG